MKKKFKLFLLFFIQFSIIKANLIVINLDTGKESEDKNLISNYLKNPRYNMSITYKSKLDKTLFFETLKMTTKEKINMRLGDEAFDSVIDTITFLYGESYLNTFINFNIDSSIIPRNYYENIIESILDIKKRNYDYGTSEPNNFSKYDVRCNYYNEKPYFNFSNFDFNYMKVVPGTKFNYALDLNGYLKVFEFDKFLNIKEYNLSLFNDPNKGYGISFINLILASPVFTTEEILFAITSQNKIYAYSVKDKTNTLFFQFINKIENIPYSNRITQISFNKNYFFISTMLNLFWYNRENISEYDSIQGNFTDILVNNRSLYTMNSEGFQIYNISNLKEVLFVFEHKYLSKFDYVLHDNTDKNSSYFIGIFVDNHPSINVNEILIELIANGDYEFSPKFNHVFITQKDISVKNIITDKFSYFTYIFDNNKLYMLTRSVPVFQIGYSYLLDLPSININSLSILARNDYEIGIENKANYFRDIILNEENSFKLLSNLSRNNPRLICSVKKSGLLYEYLVKRNDCSDYNSNGVWEFKLCLEERYYPFDVELIKDKIINAGFWIAIGIFIVVIFCIIIYVFCCLFKRKKMYNYDSKIRTTTMNSEKNKNKVEVIDIDNKNEI